jgi:integrase
LATISKRAKGWFVQIRRKGFEPEYKTLPTKEAAERWAREREGCMDRGEASSNIKQLRDTTLGDLIRRYIREVTPTKASADTERLRLSKMLAAPMCSLPLSGLTAAPIAAYRDARSGEVKPGTIARELGLLHTIIETARRDWAIDLRENVVGQVRRLPVRNARDRRLESGEMESLTKALKATRNPLIEPAITFAIETALRRGELLNLMWRDVCVERRIAHIPHTKTGYARTIPLTDAALTVLASLVKNDDRVFPLTAMALRLAWNRVRARAGMPDLNFHDLRHEAISRFAEMGLTAAELAVISGHRDPRMLMRYTHLRPTDLAKKLQGRSWTAEVAHQPASEDEAERLSLSAKIELEAVG